MTTICCLLKQLILAIFVIVNVSHAAKPSNNAVNNLDKKLKFRPFDLYSREVDDLIEFVVGEMEKRASNRRCRDLRYEPRHVSQAEVARVRGRGAYYRIEVGTRVFSKICRFAYSKAPCTATVFVPQDIEKPLQLTRLECAVE